MSAPHVVPAQRSQDHVLPSLRVQRFSSSRFPSEGIEMFKRISIPRRRIVRRAVSSLSVHKIAGGWSQELISFSW